MDIRQAEEQRLPLHLFPNPATGRVTVNTGCGETQTVRLYTASGSLVMQMPVTTEASFDVSHLAGGVYILRVGSRSEKLIVQ